MTLSCSQQQLRQAHSGARLTVLGRTRWRTRRSTRLDSLLQAVQDALGALIVVDSKQLDDALTR